MEGTRHGRGGGGVGDAGGCGARSRRHVPTSGGRRRGVGGEGWESHCAGPLREMFHMRLAGGWGSAAGGDAEPRLRQRIMASHHSAPQMREWVPPAAIDLPQTHASSLSCEEIFAEAQACTDTELFCRELRWIRPCCEPC